MLFMSIVCILIYFGSLYCKIRLCISLILWVSLF